MKDYVLKNRKGLILVIIAILITGLIEISNYRENNIVVENLSYNIIENKEMNIITEEEIKVNFFNLNKDKISFYAYIFQIDEDKFIDILKDKYADLGLNKDENIDLIFINYLFSLEKENSSLFSKEIIRSHPTKEYMLSLISYFTSIYNKVDLATSAAIAQIESGYRSKYMLKCNNIFGGMASGKLIKYRTIEYGILKYIKLLNDSYYGKGLNTIEKIGRKYNPVMTESGKIASPTWVKNVTNALKNYKDMVSNNDLKVVLAFQNNVNF